MPLSSAATSVSLTQDRARSSSSSGVSQLEKKMEMDRSSSEISRLGEVARDEAGRGLLPCAQGVVVLLPFKEGCLCHAQPVIAAVGAHRGSLVARRGEFTVR